YAFLLAILLIANITVAILSFTFSKEVKSFAQRSNGRLLGQACIDSDVSGTFIHAHDRHHLCASICAIVLLCQIRRGSDGRDPCLMFLIVVNLLFLLTGIAILGVGIYLCTSADLGKYSELAGWLALMRSLRYLLIGCGCFTILIAMCGCVASARRTLPARSAPKPRLCPLQYVILLFLVLFINLAAAIMAVVYKGDFKGMDKLLRLAGLDKQQNFFLSTPWYQQQSSNPAQFPDSCCGSGVLDSPA
uniref:Conserved plasma membrane protein n=1 Tax=Macrostomum lignano TaxID=282301 RepID=A0A1I8JPC0_9PLAT